MSDLLRELKPRWKKGLAKHLINEYFILNGAKYFIEDGS